MYLEEITDVIQTKEQTPWYCLTGCLKVGQRIDLEVVISMDMDILIVTFINTPRWKENNQLYEKGFYEVFTIS